MAAGQWILEGFFDASGLLQRIPIQQSPTRLGRSPDIEISLNTGNVSRVHAELYEQSGGLWVKDLGSTNGTYVNRDRIERPVLLEENDIVHFASVECRVIRKGISVSETQAGMMTAISMSLPMQFKALDEMLIQRSVQPFYQGIVSAENDALYAWEILGRGAHPDLPTSPLELFDLAKIANKEIELSGIMRDEGLLKAHNHGAGGVFFINTHPAELADPDAILESLSIMQSQVPSIKLTLEIHEEAVGDIGKIRHLSNSLKTMDIGMAYDDFGAGQARLLELVEVPPDYLKFDISFIRGIDTASPERRDMLKTFIRLAKGMGIKTLAEGTETEAEVNVCKDLGFDLFQGYFFDKPTPELNLTGKD